MAEGKIQVDKIDKRLPPTEAVIKKMFSAFDRNGDGKISNTEIEGVMRALGQNPTPKDIAEAMEDLDVDGSGFVEYDEFHTMVLQRWKDNTEEEIRKAFVSFDTNKNGTIERNELKRILTRSGDAPLTEADVDQLIDEMMLQADLNRNDRIEYTEFTRVMCVPPFFKN